MAKWLDNAKVEVHKQTSEAEKKKLLKKYNDEFDKKKADLAKDYAKKLAEIDKNIKTEKKVSIIYDFDEDSTVPIVKKVIDNYSFKIELLKNDINQGVVYAIKKGLMSTKGEALLVMMADLSDNLDIVDKMHEKIEEGYDVVCVLSDIPDDSIRIYLSH